MAEKPKCFDEFYYRKQDENEDLVDLVNYVENNNDKLGEYEGEIFCPECKNAELYFVHKTSKARAHLRRCPTSNHEERCSYNYLYASKKQAMEIINSLTYYQIQDKLASMINMLCKEPKKKKNPIGNGADRRKKINAWIDVEDRNELFVFYGQVKLDVEEKISEKEGKAPFTYYCLKVYNQNKAGELIFRTSLYRGKMKDDVSVGDLYYIAIIGQIGEKNWKIDMVNTNAVKYCKCEE